jgi:hypothetical protein
VYPYVPDSMDRGDYLVAPQKDGITHQSADGAVGVGMSACNELRAGTPFKRVQREVAVKTTLSDSNAAAVIVDAVTDLYVDVNESVFQQALDAAYP